MDPRNWTHEGDVFHAWFIFNLHTENHIIFTSHPSWYIHMYNSLQRTITPCTSKVTPLYFPPPPVFFCHLPYLYLENTMKPWHLNPILWQHYALMHSHSQQIQLHNFHKSTCVHITLREVRLSWRGTRGQGGDTTPPHWTRAVRISKDILTEVT